MPPPRRIAVQAASNEPHDRTAEEADSENGYSDDSADGTGRNFVRVIAAREDAIDGKVEGVCEDFFGAGVWWEGGISGSGNKFAGTIPYKAAAEVSSGDLTSINTKYSSEITTE